MNTAPDLLVSKTDFDRLHSLLFRSIKNHDAALLIEELDRAEIVPANELPCNVVRMHSIVTFTVSATGKTFKAKLVYPGEILTADEISVLSPVGSALLGLSVGQSIEWPLSNNRITTVTIEQLDNSNVE